MKINTPIIIASTISAMVGASIASAAQLSTMMTRLTMVAVKALACSPFGVWCAGASLGVGVGYCLWSVYRANYHRRSPLITISDAAFKDAHGTLPLEGDLMLPLKDLKTRATACRKIAKRCGTEIRFQMGCPRRTDANRMVATQRCAAWISENVPSMRKEHVAQAVMRAVTVALTPDIAELTAASAIFSPLAADMEHHVAVPHQVPAMRGKLGEWLALFGWTVSSAPGF